MDGPTDEKRVIDEATVRYLVSRPEFQDLVKKEVLNLLEELVATKVSDLLARLVIKEVDVQLREFIGRRMFQKLAQFLKYDQST